MNIFKKRLNNRGFSHVELVVVLLVLAGIISIGYYVYRHNTAHAGSTYTTIGTVTADNHTFTLQACINTQTGSAPNYTDTVSALVSVNGTVWVNSGRHHRYYYSYNPLVYYSVNGGNTVTENNWISGSVSAISFNLPASPSSQSFILGVEGTPGSSVQTPGPSELISSLILCNPPAPAAPTVSISASPASITSGSTATLAWTTTNATSCSASGSWSGSQIVTGSYTTPSLTSTSSYGLSCSGPGGSASSSTTVTVTVAPASSGGSSSAPGCTLNSVVAPCIGDTTTAANGWGKPIFDDEFSESSLNTAKWSTGWYNSTTPSGPVNTLENDCYAPSQVSLGSNGLDLRFIQQSSTCQGITKPYTTGLITTDPYGGSGGFTYTFGYAEAKIYLPPSGSTIANWPAFWQVTPAGASISGEEDIMEGLGGSACYHFHYSGGGPGGCASGNYSGWHIFGANWQNGVVTYYYDGKQVGQITSGITSTPMYLILNNADSTTGSSTVAPSDMLVRYVRVWQ